MSSESFQFPPRLLPAEEQIVVDNEQEFAAWLLAIREGLGTERASESQQIWQVRNRFTETQTSDIEEFSIICCQTSSLIRMQCMVSRRRFLLP